MDHGGRRHVRNTPSLMAYVARMKERFWPEFVAGGGSAERPAPKLLTA